MFERVYLGPRRVARARAGAGEVIGRIYDHLAAEERTRRRIVEFIAGMTDRFALTYAERARRMARIKDATVEAVKAAADFVDVVGRTDATPERRRRPLHGTLPVPRGADAVVLGQRRSTSSTTASGAAARGRPDHVRAASPRASTSPARSNGSPTASVSRSSTRRGSPAAGRAARRRRERMHALLDQAATYYNAHAVGVRGRDRSPATT